MAHRTCYPFNGLAEELKPKRLINADFFTRVKNLQQQYNWSMAKQYLKFDSEVCVQRFVIHLFS
jgi:hypothetical protein